MNLLAIDVLLHYHEQQQLQETCLELNILIISFASHSHDRSSSEL